MEIRPGEYVLVVNNELLTASNGYIRCSPGLKSNIEINASRGEGIELMGELVIPTLEHSDAKGFFAALISPTPHSFEVLAAPQEIVELFEPMREEEESEG